MMTHPQLYQLTYCFPCHFHSYGKAAFCLEELMMTNPHNHLYCEQYAEVGTRFGCPSSSMGANCGINVSSLWMVLLCNTERRALNVTGNIGSWKETFTQGCHVLLIQMSCCHCLSCPSAQLIGRVLYLLTQVKYTQGGLENLELSRKYFAQALRLNNRNMRALFGLYMVSTALHGEKVGGRQRKKKQSNLFCNPVVCQGWGWPLSVSSTTVFCVCFFLGGWGGEWRRGSQTGQLTADSDGELQHRKSLPLWSSLFS